MVDRAATSRAEVINEFASALRALRASVGNPSFREMSGRSQAISHTTLHEAAQGHRFPSWATTAEFVKACGGNPADYRERWTRANRALQSAGRSVSDQADGEQPRTGKTASPDEAAILDSTASPDEGADSDETSHIVEATSTRPSRRVVLLVVAVAAVAVAAVVVAVAVMRADSGQPTGARSPAALTPADCPVHQTDPPKAPPVHRGDDSAFVDDITLPDCTHVRPGSTVEKVWRLRNVGTVPWVNRWLHRLDSAQGPDQCQTVEYVPIDRTEPGGLVDVRVAVTVPRAARFCFVRFKMVDSAKHVVFPGRRPVNFQLIVD